MDDLLRHVDYIAELVGTDHIALGPNFCDLDPALTPTQRERHLGWMEGVSYDLRGSDYWAWPSP